MSRSLALSTIKSIVDAAQGSPGFSIEGYEPAPRKKGPYATVDMLSSTGYGSGSSKVVEASQDVFVSTISRMVSAAVSVNYYRGPAYDNAENLVTFLGTIEARNLLLHAGVGVTRTSGIRPLDQVVRGQVERRAQLDVFINYIVSSTEDVDVIESVDIYGGIE